MDLTKYKSKVFAIKLSNNSESETETESFTDNETDCFDESTKVDWNPLSLPPS